MSGEVSLVSIGQIFGNNRWEVVSVLGSGSFGEIYEVKDCVYGGNYAVKLEKIDIRKRGVLKSEALILKQVQHIGYVGKFVMFSSEVGFSYLVMEKLGTNVSVLRKRMPGTRFAIPTVTRVAIQMLKAIEAFHDCGFIHRDIKPSNFALGFGAKAGRLYILDFGLSRMYRRSDGSHREARVDPGFRGTARYASIDAHMEKDLGRKDDIWSLFYVMVELALGTLPWTRLKTKEEIAAVKMTATSSDLIIGLPSYFLTMLQHLQALQFEDRPDYAYLLSQMQTSLNERDEQLLEFENGSSGGIKAQSSRAAMVDPSGKVTAGAGDDAANASNSAFMAGDTVAPVAASSKKHHRDDRNNNNRDDDDDDDTTTTTTTTTSSSAENDNAPHHRNHYRNHHEYQSPHQHNSNSVKKKKDNENPSNDSNLNPNITSSNNIKIIPAPKPAADDSLKHAPQPTAAAARDVVVMHDATKSAAESSSEPRPRTTGTGSRPPPIAIAFDAKAGSEPQSGCVVPQGHGPQIVITRGEEAPEPPRLVSPSSNTSHAGGLPYASSATSLVSSVGPASSGTSPLVAPIGSSSGVSTAQQTQPKTPQSPIALSPTSNRHIGRNYQKSPVVRVGAVSSAGSVAESSAADTAIESLSLASPGARNRSYASSPSPLILERLMHSPDALRNAMNGYSSITGASQQHQQQQQQQHDKASAILAEEEISRSIRERRRNSASGVISQSATQEEYRLKLLEENAKRTTTLNPAGPRSRAISHPESNTLPVIPEGRTSHISSSPSSNAAHGHHASGTPTGPGAGRSRRTSNLVRTTTSGSAVLSPSTAAGPGGKSIAAHGTSAKSQHESSSGRSKLQSTSAAVLTTM